MPVEEDIVATVVLPLVQTPPVVALLNAPDELAQIIVCPVMAAGSGFTVTVKVSLQPVPSV